MQENEEANRLTHFHTGYENEGKEKSDRSMWLLNKRIDLLDFV